MTASAITHELPTVRQDALVIGLVGLAHCISHFCHMLLAPLFPVFMKEFGLSYAQLGSLVTIFFVISGVGQALSGFVVDRFGARPVLFGAMASFVLAALVASQAQGYSGLALAAVFAGIGNSPFHPVDFTILNQRVSPQRLGYAFSVHGLSGNLGWAIAPIFLVGLSTWFGGWRSAYMCAALLIAAVMVVLWCFRNLLSTNVIRSHGGGHSDHALSFLKLPVLWWCFGFFFFSTMTLAIVQSFGVSILEQVHRVNFETATLAVSGYMFASAAGMFFGGFVASRYHASEQVVMSCMGAGAALLLLCSTGWLGALGTMVILAATGLSIGIGGPSRDLMIKRATPKGATGRVYGTVYSGLDAGFALAPLLFGWLMDRSAFSWVLVGAATALLVALLMAAAVGQYLSKE